MTAGRADRVRVFAADVADRRRLNLASREFAKARISAKAFLAPDPLKLESEHEYGCAVRGSSQLRGGL